MDVTGEHGNLAENFPPQSPSDATYASSTMLLFLWNLMVFLFAFCTTNWRVQTAAQIRGC
jgi:hypothetical protein